MTDSSTPSDSAFPTWLRDTRANWIGAGAALLAAGAGSSHTTDDLTGVILSLTCSGLALVCFLAAAIDGPHLKTKQDACGILCFCQVRTFFTRTMTAIKQWTGRSSTERNRSTNTA